MKRLDLTGQRFGRLTAQSVAENAGRRVKWACLCDCGASTTVTTDALRTGKTSSCGCHRLAVLARGNAALVAKNTKHGLSAAHQREHKSWSCMMGRCYSPSNIGYARYGGRGIKVASRWHDFRHFFADMGERPPGTTLDRIDSEKDYGPDNCRWATWETQQNNKTNSRYFDWGGRRLTLSQIARENDIKPSTLNARVNKIGLALDEAVRMKKYGRTG